MPSMVLELDADNKPTALSSSNVGSEAGSWFQQVTFSLLGRYAWRVTA